MNHLQARTLANLMEVARPRKHWDEDPEPDIHAHSPFEYVNGNDLRIAFFTLTNSLDRFPEVFYIRPDGSVYVWDEDTESENDVPLSTVRWLPNPKHKHFSLLTHD